MANSNLVKVGIETADTAIVRVNQNNQMKPEFIILLKTFLMIVTYQMAPFGKNERNWGPRTCYKYAVSNKYVRSCTNQLIIIQILSIPPLQFPSQTIHPCVKTTIHIFFTGWRNWFLRTVFWHAASKPYANVSG